MKLFNPESKNHIVYAVLPKAAKEGTAPAFRTVDASDFEEAERKLDKFQLRNAYPYPLGRYDEFGRYMTYKPPVEGGTPGRFVIHPFAEEERKREEAFA
jgi:hypothetical protein